MSDTDAGDEDVDLADMAALAFEPWQPMSDGWTPPSNAEWAMLANPHLISVRLAWLALHKSKEELMAVAAQLGDEGLIELVGQIGRSADWFEGLHKLLDSAECRIMSAYAAQHSKEDGRH